MKFIYRTILIPLFVLLISNSFASGHIGNQIGVVATDDPLATAVGMDVLAQRGNAIDAAVAVGYALAVVQPCCGNIGGGGFMLIHFANGNNTVINFRETAPGAASPDIFFDKKGHALKSSTSSYAAVAIPGTVLGLNTALKKYGTLPLKKLMQPAIDLASKGYPLTTAQINTLNLAVNSFAKQPNVAAIFLNQGRPFKRGEILRQKQLAKTLSLIATQGASVFYKGKIAQAVVKASNQNGGIISKEDFANYQIKEQAPLICNYRGYQVITLPPPASGATLCEILNITEGYPLSALGYHTARSVHNIVEAMRYAYADRNQYLGDPDFVKIPLRKLISKSYAAQIRSHIISDKAGDSRAIGFISFPSEKQETTAYTVADRYGNVVTVTYTINGNFGAKLIAGRTGFFLNNEIDDFTLREGVANQFGLIQGSANLIAPRKRPLSSISQAMIFKNGKFLMTVGTPGGSTIISQNLEAIENVLDYKRNIKQAINALRFHMQWLPDKIYMEPGVFNKKTIVQLQHMGYLLQLGSPYRTLYWGNMVGITQNPKNDLLTAAAQEARKPRL